MKDEKRSKTLTMVVAILILFCAIISFFLLIIFNGNETRTSSEAENKKIEALVCRSAGREDGFFHSKTANQIVNEIKATYNGNTYDKLYYSYEGTYRSEDVAKGDESMHADYNIYMGEHNLAQSSLSPTFSLVKNKFRLTLYADEKDDFNKTTAVFFYVTDEDVDKFKSYDMDEMKKYYEAKDFKCNIVKKLCLHTHF